MALNPLPANMRERERYLVFEIISNANFSLEQAVNAIWNAVFQLFGDVGASSFSIWIPSNLFDEKNSVGIVRCNHQAVECVRAALASIKEIEGASVTFKTLGVTGTIKSAKRKFLGQAELTDFSKK